MGFGYMGKIMWVDLSTGAITFEDLPDSFYEQVLSGAGLAARILYNRIPAEADPLGPDNVLGFVSGLLTGTGTLFSGRWMVAGKSPLTGGTARRTAAEIFLQRSNGAVWTEFSLPELPKLLCISK